MERLIGLWALVFVRPMLVLGVFIAAIGVGLVLFAGGYFIVGAYGQAGLDSLTVTQDEAGLTQDDLARDLAVQTPAVPAATSIVYVDSALPVATAPTPLPESEETTDASEAVESPYDEYGILRDLNHYVARADDGTLLGPIRENFRAVTADDLISTYGEEPRPQHIIIPAIGLESTVVDLSIVWDGETSEWETADHAVGYHIGSATPGEVGNTVMSGHVNSPIAGEGSGADEMRKRLEVRKLDAMLGYCELTTCRRQTLLAYFGETLPERCGNCDNCLTPVASWDATEACQKALSCVYRTGQRFGAGYLTDVLRGLSNKRIRRFGHDRIPTHGVGADIDPYRWRSLFRQLVARGLLSVDMEGYGSLRLTASSWPVLRGEEEVLMREDLRPARAGAGRRPKEPPPPPDPATWDESLWEALRAQRTRLARAQSLPPYVIFHDSTLREMVERRPRTLEEFARLSGVGETKLSRYGEEFLAVIMAREGTPSGRPEEGG